MGATNFLLKHGPEATTIIADPYNGRYRVVSPLGAEWRSFSWTTRGFVATVYLCLRQAWLYEYKYMGTPAPYNLDDLVSEFTENPDDED